MKITPAVLVLMKNKKIENNFSFSFLSSMVMQHLTKGELWMQLIRKLWNKTVSIALYSMMWIWYQKMTVTCTPVHHFLVIFQLQLMKWNTGKFFVFFKPSLTKEFFSLIFSFPILNFIHWIIKYLNSLMKFFFW